MGKLFRLIIFLFALSCMNVIGYAQTAVVKGHAYGADGPLNDAIVFLEKKMQLTNNIGEFFFIIRPGVHTLTVTHAGYKKIEKKIEVKVGLNKVINVRMIPDDLMGEVVVLGSRTNIQRSNLNNAVPVDIISSKQLAQTGQANLVQMLNFIAPSFNASRQVANEPVTLRGLDPEHLLILLNGTRYHNTAWLNQGNNRGPLGRGSVGNDLSSIPISSIEKIEILRDGSAAQYGSDAVAGVINIRLKESVGKTSAQLLTGQYYLGDGNNLSLGINHGIDLRRKYQSLESWKGFLNISADLGYQGRTDRGGIYDTTVYFDPPVNASPSMKNIFFAKDDLKISERGFNRHAPASHVGNPKFNHYGILINGQYPVSNRVLIFWTTAFNDRIVNSRAAYVFPKAPYKQLDTVLYSDGFQPRITTNTVDISEIAGIRGLTKTKWHWDVNSSYGYNSMISSVENTNNASQSYVGKNMQTTFYTGKYAYQQLTNNINFSKSCYFLPERNKLLNLGFGGEWRLENYHTFPGEEASWKNYDPTKTLAGGAQGSAGISPGDLVNKRRSMGGGYLDLESELNGHLLLKLAGRYEYYSDYGGNAAGKLAARYKFSDRFILRGSVSNGFRAPSLQQRYYTSTVTSMSRLGNASTSVIRGVFPENSPVVRALDIPSLKSENTININAGLTALLFQRITFTVDAYYIQIKNRIIFGGIFDRVKIPVINAILSADPNLSQIDQVQFFTNAVNTRTGGADVTINGKWTINKSRLEMMLAANFTNTTVFGKIQTSDKIPDDPVNSITLFPIDERTRLQKGQPGSKIILSITYKKGKIECVLNNTRFGSTVVATTYTSPSIVLNELLSPKILTSFNLNYHLKKELTITGGANNIFNVYPDRLQNRANMKNGILIYSQEASPFGYNGGYYFAGLSFIL